MYSWFGYSRDTYLVNVSCIHQVHSHTLICRCVSFRDNPLGNRSLTADVELRRLYNPCLFYVGKVHYNGIRSS